MDKADEDDKGGALPSYAPHAAHNALLRVGGRRAKIPTPPKPEYATTDYELERSGAPEFMLTSKQVPWIDQWVAGQDYTLVVRVHLDKLKTVDTDGKRGAVAHLTIKEVAEPNGKSGGK